MTFKQHFQYIEEQLVLEKLIKISGPALAYKPAKVMVSGPVGTSHFMLYPKLTKALAKKMNISEDKAEKIIDTSKDIIDGFKTSEGKFVDREQAWNIAKKYKEQIKQYDQQIKSFGGVGELASEYL